MWKVRRPHASGRRDTHDRAYLKARREMLSQSDLCGICGHGGAKTADHVIARKQWLRLYGKIDGFNDIANLQPAHGTMGNKLLNPCPICGRLCNQSRKDRPLNQFIPHSRDW